jgi:hypothetical protein
MESKGLGKVDLQIVVPFATSTNVVADERIAWFGTPCSKVVP